MIPDLQELLREALPEAVAERCRVLRDGEPAAGGFVLYWMKGALRADENPALDAAVGLANALGRPCFVYQGLSERYRFASDRHHRFLLEGAREAHAALAGRGIGSAFHLEREGQHGPHLLSLARRAALVVTEEVPVEPLRGWTRRLAERGGVPVLSVDASCLVPMTLTRKAPQRAFAFRRATQRLRDERLHREWHELEPEHGPFVPELPFAPVDLGQADLAALIARCAIDHSVAPVPGTRGGTSAGLARWEAFRDSGLRSYARRRNDPLAGGTSRLSPYLHAGMISPFLVAREAAEMGGDGAEKFLDELLVWRELAWHWCFHSEEQESLEALPDWARQTLLQHADDERPALHSWETLARGRSGDPLWDAAQRSLLIHGEVHNNVRMTWGKALLEWAEHPAEALRLLIDLNHRFALDGRDPSSYGGLLWCLGLFDRAFEPEREVTGTLRPRPTAQHARRLDVAEYARRVRRPAVSRPPRVAVVGGGFAGLACARTLADHGLEVRVFDKGRGPGGRASTRRVEEDATTLRFDHGAQYLTARDPRFRRVVESWVQDGVAAPWCGRLVALRAGESRPAGSSSERFVGRGGMSALLRHLGRDLSVSHGARVERLERDGARWRLHGPGLEGAGAFDQVLVATPAPQAAALLEAAPGLQASVAGARLAPCLTVLAAFEEELQAGFDGAFVEDSPLAWACREASKPGRPLDAAWTLHATPDWSAAHLEDDAQEVTEALLAAFAAALGRDGLPAPRHAAAHRWRFARTVEPLGRDCLHDDALGLGACGDWCRGERIEDAWLSGVALAGRILGRLADLPAGGELQGELFARTG